MTINFEALKQNRKSNFDKLTSELNKLNSTVPQGSSDDDRFWKPDVDKAGNGYAIIRFLPALAGEDMPFVRIWDHGFQGPGGWYIEKSLTTFNKPDPVSEMNTKLWNSGIESNKEIVRKQKRRLSYFSNILVVKDPTRPENEGKVFLFKYGKKIFDKINEAMHPQFADEKAVNPFDFWDGANFKLKIRQVEGYRNYDKSEFDSVSAISNDDDEIKRIRVTYPILDASSRFKEFRPCIKKYLYSNIRSRILAVEPQEWDVALYLPIQQFKKEQAKTVWQESVQEIKAY